MGRLTHTNAPLQQGSEEGNGILYFPGSGKNTVQMVTDLWASVLGQSYLPELSLFSKIWPSGCSYLALIFF